MRIPLSLLILAAVVVGRTLPESEEEDAREDVRRAIPGEPGRDYPNLATVPATSFSCQGRREGFYADPETRCQVFHICSLQRGVMGLQSFLCPNGTIFNRNVNTCDWWNKVFCERDRDDDPTEEDSYIVNPENRPLQEEASKINELQREKISTRRRRPGSSFKPFREISMNLNALESRNGPVTRERVSVQILKGDDYKMQTLSNAISTEGYQQLSTQSFRKTSGNKVHPAPPSEKNRVSEVTIKPRVRYTHNLRSSTDNPLHTLNPLIHVARDSSLLSTFTKSSEPSIKVTHPVERYVINDVLPQYNGTRQGDPVTEDRKNTVTQLENDDGNPIYFLDGNNDENHNQNDNEGQVYFPLSAIPPLMGVTANTVSNFESNSVSLSHGNNGSILPTDKPYQSNFNEASTGKGHYFLQVGTNVLSRNKTSNKDYLSLVRVSTGYSFTNPDENKNYINTPRTLQVTHSYSVEENFSTEGPEVRYKPITLPESTGNTKTISQKVSQSEEPLRSYGSSEDSLNGINAQHNLKSSDVGSQHSGVDANNHNNPEKINDTNIEFINRFIVEEPKHQLQGISGYNQDNFDTLTSKIPSNTPNFLSTNYVPISSPETNLFSGIPQESNQDVQLPSTSFNFSPGSDLGVFQDLTVTQNYINGNIISQSGRGHYITKSPPEINRFNHNYNQNYEANNGNARLIKVEKPIIYPTTQSPEPQVTSPNNGKSIISQSPLYNTFNTQDQFFASKYEASTERSINNNVALQSYDSQSGSNQLISNGHGPISPKYPQQYQTYSILPQNSGSPQYQHNFHEDKNILTSEKSVEIEDIKEKENIFSGLKIANVSPSIQAYSWSMVITPSTVPEDSSLKSFSQTNPENNQQSPITPSLENYNRNYFQGFNLETISPSTETNSLSSTAAPSQYSSLDSFSISDSNRNHQPHKNYSFNARDQTTATFLNHNEEVNLYTPSSKNTISPALTSDTSISFNGISPQSQVYDNNISTERNFLFNSFQQSTPLDGSTITTKSVAEVKDNSSTEYLLSTEGYSSLAYSTPKPFSESQDSYEAHQLHPTPTPYYKDGNKHLLNPADLLNINSLPSTTTEVNVGSAEFIKSIGFSFDSKEDLEQFEIAKSKGWFSL